MRFRKHSFKNLGSLLCGHRATQIACTETRLSKIRPNQNYRVVSMISTEFIFSYIRSSFNFYNFESDCLIFSAFTNSNCLYRNMLIENKSYNRVVSMIRAEFIFSYVTSSFNCQNFQSDCYGGQGLCIGIEHESVSHCVAQASVTQGCIYRPTDSMFNPNKLYTCLKRAVMLVQKNMKKNVYKLINISLFSKQTFWSAYS